MSVAHAVWGADCIIGYTGHDSGQHHRHGRHGHYPQFGSAAADRHANGMANGLANTWLSATPENFRISGLVGTNVLYLVPVLLELPQSPFFSTFGGTIR